MMAKYGLSTNVYKTYVADFHGTTAELFRATSPDQPLNQAVCYDCHGYHDVESVRKVGQAQIDKRLLVRCQVCHKGATASFLSAWTGHYIPSPTRYAPIYWVRVFYRLVIPGTSASSSSTSRSTSGAAAGSGGPRERSRSRRSGASPPATS